jgi:hypothetical protein
LTTVLGRASLLVVLLVLTTALRRLIVPVVVFLVWTPAAYAWSWPVEGPVLQPFAYDESHPYASGQHRGVDIGADSTGETVVAPAGGTVSFAGVVPVSGKTVTIETSDGYSVTLTHLGSVSVAKGATVAEGETVATVGPSGTPELDGPYVHLGIRIAADPNGYLDPLTFLPPVADTGASEGGSTATQPVASGGSSSSTAPVTPLAPAPAAAAGTPAAGEPGTILEAPGRRVSPHRSRQTSRTETQSQRGSRQSPLSHPARAERRVKHRPRVPHRRMSEPMSASRRPVIEAAAPEELSDLGAGHKSRSLRPTPAARRPHQVSPAVLALASNGAAALVAVAAAIAAARRRRRELACGICGAEIIRLRRPAPEPQARRAA